MSDEILRKILEKAAGDSGFCQRLFDERDKAIDEIGIEISEAEKAMLKAIPISQLEAMLKLKPSIWRRQVFSGRLLPYVATGAAVAILAGLCLPSLGVSPDRVHEINAASNLKQLVFLELLYKEKYGCYADFPELALYDDKQHADFVLFVKSEAQPYGYQIILTEEGSFTITATCKGGSANRPGFEVGADGAIRALCD
jgi:hypothetical protein